MKNLFNNPWVVISFGIFSLIYLIASVSGLVLDEEAQASVPIDMDASLRVGGAGTHLPFSTAMSVSGMDKSSITWLDEISRDPFAAVRVTNYATNSTEAFDINHCAGEKAPRLGAIFSGENTRMAVVDQQLVREGDRIGSYRVIAINSSQVILGRDAERFTLDALL